MKHVVCFSGGHSSALVAIEVVRRYGPESVTLLNHNINSSVEDADIKRFKVEVAAHLGLPVTQANYMGLAEPPDQFDIAMSDGAFANGRQIFCTSRLKTEPFREWLAKHAPPGTAVVYYGFDERERERIQRRSSIMGAMGYETAFPLAHWPRTIRSTDEIGVRPPLTYGVWKHANCVGCIKGRRQHWYAVYIHRQDVWQKAKLAEEEIGHSIQADQITLTELEPTFRAMRDVGVEATERIASQRFWVDAKRLVKRTEDAQRVASCGVLDNAAKPCECTESAIDDAHSLAQPPRWRAGWWVKSAAYRSRLSRL